VAETYRCVTAQVVESLITLEGPVCARSYLSVVMLVRFVVAVERSRSCVIRSGMVQTAAVIRIGR